MENYERSLTFKVEFGVKNEEGKFGVRTHLEVKSLSTVEYLKAFIKLRDKLSNHLRQNGHKLSTDELFELLEIIHKDEQNHYMKKLFTYGAN